MASLVTSNAFWSYDWAYNGSEWNSFSIMAAFRQWVFVFVLVRVVGPCRWCSHQISKVSRIHSRNENHWHHCSNAFVRSCDWWIHKGCYNAVKSYRYSSQQLPKQLWFANCCDKLPQSHERDNYWPRSFLWDFQLDAMFELRGPPQRQWPSFQNSRWCEGRVGYHQRQDLPFLTPNLSNKVIAYEFGHRFSENSECPFARDCNT